MALCEMSLLVIRKCFEKEVIEIVVNESSILGMEDFVDLIPAEFRSSKLLSR